MGYYIRAFCASEKVPTPRALLEYAKNKGVSLGLEVDGIDIDNTNWDQLEWVYKDGKLPIQMECNRDTSEDGLFREEIDEFLDFIGKPGFSMAKRRVIEHLGLIRDIPLFFNNYGRCPSFPPLFPHAHPQGVRLIKSRFEPTPVDVQYHY